MNKPVSIWPVIIVAGLAVAPLIGDGTPAWALAVETQRQGGTAPEIAADPPGALPVSRAPGDPLPPGGTDTIVGTTGEIHIEAVAGNIYGLTPETYILAIDPDPLNNLTVVVRQNPVCDPYGTINMTMTSLDLVASDGIFAANVHLNPLVASTGQAIEPAVGDPCDFPVDSFFDVYVEIDIPAVPTGIMHNNNSIYIYAPDNVMFPPYGSSYQTLLGWTGEQLYEGTTATGLWVRYVRHDMPQDCGPDPSDPHRCLQVDCSLLGFPPDFQCLPSLINWDPANLDYTVIQCECQDPDYCHIEPGAADQPPSCTGNCPSPQICVEYQQDVGGTIDYWCQCEDVQPPCDITADLKGCAGYCPPATPDCRPTRLIRSTTGAYQVDLCECVDPNNDCWLGYDEANDQVWCEGVCPAPLECTLISRGTAQGYIEFWCECHDPGNPPPCGPHQGLACEGACPPDQACVPVEWTEVTPGDFDITACECRGYDDCRGMGDLISPPTCQGNCPTPEVCTMTQPTSQSYRCDCEQPYTEACCFQDGSCLDLDPNDCSALGGESQGAGSACANVTSACCLADGACLMADEYCCVHEFNGTVYSGQSCLGMAACCFDDGSCVDMDRLCCEVDQGGVAQAAGTACVDTVVACCLEDGTCVETDPLCCDELNGVLSGEAACLGDGDLNGIDDACEDCYPSAAFPGCQEDFCPPGYECLESRVIRWEDGTWSIDACECVKRTEDCWVVFDAGADQVWCDGVCPDPEECTLISRGTASGYIEFWCECHDPNNPPECGPPLGDPAFVCEGACPPDEACVPTEYWWDPNLQRLIVTECDCRGFNECRGYTSLLVPPTCQGDCPPFEVCDLVEIDTDGDEIADTYRCECEDSCQPTPDHLNCEPVLCPIPTEECLPVRIRGPAPFFPPGGIDILHGTSGELEIVDPTGASSVFVIDPTSEPNVTVVQRQNPVGGGGGGGATIDMTITQMNFDSNDGMLKVTVRLGSVAPSTGQVIGYNDTQDYPAESFFDVYVEVDIEGFGTGLYNADSIRIEATGLTTIPPWGVVYETPPTMADVPLYLPGGQPSDYSIRRVIHVPPPPPPPYEVLECDCIDRDYCHVEFDQASPTVPPWCSGGCPVGYLCEMQQYVDPTGWIEYWCECNCVCGDIDHSGTPIDLNDFAVFALCYGYVAPNAACPPAEFDCSDMDENGVIDLNDFATFATLFGLTSSKTVPNCD